MLEAALKISSIFLEHRALLDMTFKQFLFAEPGIAEAFIILSPGFEVRQLEPLCFN